MRKIFLAFLLCILFFLYKGNHQCLHAEETIVIPLGLPKINWPENNPYSAKKAALGKKLFYDPRISSDGTISCATCHGFEHAFTDGKRLSTGIRKQLGTRHSPSIINIAYAKDLFWDGRAKTIEEQAQGPISNPKEMTIELDPHIALQQCSERIKDIPEYRILCKEVFGNEECTIEQITKAVATFERTVLSGNSAFDKYMAGDKTAMTDEQVFGYQTFKRVGCANCHFGPTFSDGRFLNIGIGMDVENPDLGRYNVTKDNKDWGAFKVSMLRDVENTSPYMHDGSLKTLEEVIDYYDRGGNPNKNLHPLMKPLHLTEKEKKALVSFMKALNGHGWHHASP